LPPLKILCPHLERPNWEGALASLEGAGIRVEIESIARPHYRAKLGGEYDLVHAGWRADHPDAHELLHLFHSTFPSNYGGWANKEYDALCRQAEATPCLEDRVPLYTRMVAILEEDVPALYGWHDRIQESVRDNWEGYEPSVNPLGRVWLKYVRPGT
jgi:ABC-type oligopeptide transport system substrate-binding subunit